VLQTPNGVDHQDSGGPSGTSSTVSLPQPTPSAPLVWLIESRTSAGTFYQVSQVTETGWRCSCPAGPWGRPCWHVRQCQAEVAQLRADLAAGIPIVDDGLPRVSTSRLCGICDVRHGCEHCPRVEWCICPDTLDEVEWAAAQKQPWGRVYHPPYRSHPQGQLAVALYRIESAIESLTEAEQQDVLAELLPIARLVRRRAEVRQSRREGSPLVGRIRA
jgi:hypothetical protein